MCVVKLANSYHEIYAFSLLISFYTLVNIIFEFDQNSQISVVFKQDLTELKEKSATLNELQLCII